jgi:hypothetical protein
MPAIDVRLLRRNPSVEEAPLQGEMMLFDATTSKFFVLNPSMALAWKCCDGEHSLEEIAGKLVADFQGVTAEQATNDVMQAVDELRKLGLLLDVT